MLTNEQVLEIFKAYLDEDQATEVVQTRHGAAVMLWDYTAKTWSDVECCPTPEDLFDNLMDSFVSYKKFKVWELHRREIPNAEDWEQIHAMQRQFLQKRKEVETT